MTNVSGTLKKIYTYCTLDDFILIYPFYSIFMAAKGLSLFQISTLFIIWSVTDLLTNVPTGVLADKYSRKNLLGLGQLLKAAGFSVWFLYPHYVGFAIGFVLWGVGGAFTSGTFEALVYDELKSSKQENNYVRVIGRADSFALLGNLAATLAAGAAILLGYGFLFAGSIVATVVSSLLAFSLPETPRFEQVADSRYLTMLRAGVKQALHSRTILGVILLGGFIGAIYGSLEEYTQLFFRDTGVSLSIVSWAVGATVAAAAAGSLVAYRYEKLSTSRFMLTLVLAGLLLLAAGASGSAYGIALLIGYTFLIRMLQAVYDGKLQHSITGGLRATISSFSGVVLELMSIAVYLAYGLVTRHANNLVTFKIFGMVVVSVAVLYLLISPRLLSKRSIAAAAHQEA